MSTTLHPGGDALRPPPISLHTLVNLRSFGHVRERLAFGNVSELHIAEEEEEDGDDDDDDDD